MKIRIFGSFLLISLFSVFLISILSGQEAKEIVKKSYELMQGQSNYSEISMTVHRPKWDRTIGLKSWSKGNDYALIYITEPLKEKGQVFLKRGTEMWNWVPTIDRMIKIPPSMMLQSWMGSDITNDDLVNESSIVEDYSQRILGNETFGGYECYKIELVPDEDAPVVWGMIISWISKNEYYTLKNEYFDEEGELINTETLSRIKEFGDRSIPTYFEIIPLNKENHSTIMEIKNIRFNERIDDTFFSIQNMKNVR